MPKKNIVQKNRRRKKRGLKHMNGIRRPAVSVAVEPFSFAPALIATTEND